MEPRKMVQMNWYRAEIETQMQRTNVWTPREESGGGGMNWEIGIDIYTLPAV